MRRRQMAIVLLAAGPVLALIDACNGKTSTPTESRTTNWNYDPTKYSTACAVDGDCVVRKPINDCYTCCGHVAVRADESAADLDAVMKACRQPGAPMGYECGLGCFVDGVACRKQRCHLRRASPCSSGPAHDSSAEFPYLENANIGIPYCTPRCGTGLVQPTPSPVPIAALPSGSCTVDDDPCQMQIQHEQVAVGCVYGFRCVCDAGNWQCVVTNKGNACGPQDAGTD